MDLNEKIAALGAVPGTEGPWVTVTLDVSKSGRVPKSTSLFLREALDSETGSPARRGPQAIRLRAAASRIRHHVDATLRPETEGLYLTTDGSTVNSLELLVPLRNSFSVGPRPAVAPLVESGRRWPPTLIARFDERRVEILEFDGGIVSEVRVLRAPKVDQDVEGAVVGARAGRHGLRVSGAGSGGDRRDRFQQRRDEGVEKMFRLAAGMIATWGRRRPAGKRLMLEGSASLRSLLIRQFSGIKIRTLPSAAAPRRNPAALLSGIKAALREDYDAEVRERLAEFHARRATGTGLVLGPENAPGDGRRPPGAPVRALGRSDPWTPVHEVPRDLRGVAGHVPLLRGGRARSLRDGGSPEACPPARPAESDLRAGIRGVAGGRRRHGGPAQILIGQDPAPPKR
jgi:hypothetical protein